MDKMIQIRLIGQTAYCVLHHGQLVVAAIEKEGRLEKYYYTNNRSVHKGPITLENIYRSGYFGGDVIPETCRYGIFQPHASKDIDSLLVLVDRIIKTGEFEFHLMHDSRYVDKSNAVKLFFETPLDGLPTHLNRDIILHGTQHPTSPNLFIDEAKQHIEREEYIAEVYTINDPMMHDAFVAVREHIILAINDTKT